MEILVIVVVITMISSWCQIGDLFMEWFNFYNDLIVLTKFLSYYYYV